MVSANKDRAKQENRLCPVLLGLQIIHPAEAAALVRQDFTDAVYRDVAGSGDFFLILSLSGQADYSLCQLNSLGSSLSSSLLKTSF